MKYCIGCSRLNYEDKQTSGGSTMTGSWTSEEASMGCQLGHWRYHLNEGNLSFDFEKAMETAATCPDFSERPAPEVGERHE